MKMRATPFLSFSCWLFFSAWLWQNTVWAAFSLQISCDEGLLPCRMHRILQKFYCCPKNFRRYW